MSDNKKTEVDKLARVVAEIAAALGDAAELSAKVWARLTDLDRRIAAVEAETLRPFVVPHGWRGRVTHDAPHQLQ